MSQIIIHKLIKNTGSWTIRIDSPHGNEDYHQRHVHITKKKLSGEYSWNEDGSRHDKHKFPTFERYIKKAISLAENELNISKGTLKFITINSGKVFYSVESIHNDSKDLFRTYIHKHKLLIILMSENSLISVILNLNTEME